MKLVKINSIIDLEDWIKEPLGTKEEEKNKKRTLFFKIDYYFKRVLLIIMSN